MKILDVNQAKLGIKLTNEELADGEILIKVKPEDFNSGYVTIEIVSQEYLERVEAETKARNEAERLKRPAILFHPECRMGDCDTCRNYSCGIYQGYDEPVPAE